MVGSGLIPTIIGNDPSAHRVMAALDAAIHALLFKSQRQHELQPRLIGIIIPPLKFRLFRISTCLIQIPRELYQILVIVSEMADL